MTWWRVKRNRQEYDNTNLVNWVYPQFRSTRALGEIYRCMFHDLYSKHKGVILFPSAVCRPFGRGNMTLAACRVSMCATWALRGDWPHVARSLLDTINVVRIALLPLCAVATFIACGLWWRHTESYVRKMIKIIYHCEYVLIVWFIIA